MSSKKNAKPKLPNILENIPDFQEELVSESVVINGKVITVNPGTFVMAIKREGIRKAMIDNPSPDIETQVARYTFYAPLVACSTGDVPTEEEFLTWRDGDVDKWYKVALKINPHWFEDSADIEKKSP